ncbi:MAG: hypothetical protein A2V62_07540 [Nitrospirae bacterium RBG_19FT_COMBO_58_9]|nr:MAG: hypothetical protein A2V62_07540 [Nitrospirae bacterium RBG_19FT_COMBO_58_9]
MRCQIALRLCEAALEPANKLFGRKRLVKASWLNRGNGDLRKKAQEAHRISIARKTGQTGIDRQPASPHYS